MLEGSPWGAHWHFPLVGPRSGAGTADPGTLRSIRLKYEIWPWGPKFDTDSRGLSPKATGLHLVGDRLDTWSFTLHSTALLRFCFLRYCSTANFTKFHLLLYCSTALLCYCSTANLTFWPLAVLFASRIVSRKQYYFYCSTALLLYCQLH